MIPTSYLLKPIYADRFGDPSNPHPAKPETVHHVVHLSDLLSALFHKRRRASH